VTNILASHLHATRYAPVGRARWRRDSSARAAAATGHFVESWVSTMKELRENQRKKLSDSPDRADAPNVAEAVEAVFGCKWSIRILELIRTGVCRPGEIERSLTGLTTKVQHHYLRRMVSLGILRREVFAEVPPRVEYHLTSMGERFVPLLHQIAEFQRRLEQEAGASQR
jgi:DNA-binding HxlR family transcriptional regulator